MASMFQPRHGYRAPVMAFDDCPRYCTYANSEPDYAALMPLQDILCYRHLITLINLSTSADALLGGKRA